MGRASFAAGALLVLASLPSHGTSFLMPSPSSNSRQRSSQQVMEMSVSTKKMPGTAKLETPWEELGFEFRPTNTHVEIVYKNGEWGEPELKKVS
jgi:hypothetical protein